MSYNGSGTFNINTTGQPVVAGTIISAATFNALTADLATGLTTALTKDGQTTATARIPFAQGITSTLVTDASSVSTGSIITAGGVGIAKKLYVGTDANIAGNAAVTGTLGVTGVATFSAAPIYSSLTASSAVATDASKGLVSVANTGTGSNVLATAPTIASANLTTALTLAGAAGTNGQVLTSAGSGLPSWTTISAGLAAASLAEMEAATSNTVAATPLNTNSHPGVAKVWIKCDAAGGILGSYNVTSITDAAVGRVTVTIATDFSSTNYVIVGTSVNGSSDCYIAIESTGTGPTDPTAGAFKALNLTAAGGYQDPSAYMLACFGDQ